MEKILRHGINIPLFAKSLNISEEQAVNFLTDGRIIGRLGEFIISDKDGWCRSNNENTSFDVFDYINDKVEVRSITKSISFAASKEVGYGRKVTEEGFTDKLNSVDYYIGIDFRNLSELTFIKIGKDDVLDMCEVGIMRKNKSVNSKKFYKYIEEKLTI